MSDFTDKIAVVTGGGSGIGEALCRELGRQGASVTVADIEADRAERTAAAIEGAGGRAKAATVDVSDDEAVWKLIEGTYADAGRLDYVFNNAGIGVVGDARDLTLDDWRQVLAVDQWGVIYGTTIAYRLMAQQGHGHIVNTASFAGLLPHPTNAPYCTAKHAVVGLSLSLRLEGEPLGIRVSVVCPGLVRTNILSTTRVVNADISGEELAASTPVRPLDADQAASTILRGLLRNRAIIVFPRSARVMWRLMRLHPSLVNPSLRRMVSDWQKWRKAS